jgi:hypothetical protein
VATEPAQRVVEQLRDAGFGDAQQVADLPQLELLAIIEFEDLSVPSGQGLERALQLLMALAKLRQRVGGGRVGIDELVLECVV